MQYAKAAAALAALALAISASAEDSKIDAAKEFFARYVSLENAYDPGVADLYADEAFIKTRRSMPMGDPQDFTFPAAQYRTLLRQNLSVAKARGDRSSYSDVGYTPEGQFVRITAARKLASKEASPITLLVGPSPGGKWLIYGSCPSLGNERVPPRPGSTS